LVQWQTMVIKRINLEAGLQHLILLCLILMIPASQVRAQEARQITLSAPDLAKYPDITFYIDVNSREGRSITHLTADQITLDENGIEQELLDFQVLSPGIQLVAAFNLSNPFAIQDINGNSRFDFIKQSLLDWAAQAQTSAPDDISIVSNDGLEHSHLVEKSAVTSILEGYDPDLRETESNFNVLAKAISIASDPVDQPGMKRIVLFYTSQPTTEGFAAIDNLISQAVDNQVKVYTILVSSPAFFSSAGAAKLQDLSSNTHGLFLPFSGDEPLEDLTQLFEPLHSTYLVNYRSQIVTPGTHTLEVTVDSTLSPIVGVREFFIDVQPPNPIFVSPPRVISREILEENSMESTNQVFQPETYPLHILLEFPDNHPRDIEELIFRVDGEIVARKTSPPYDEFIWDLSSYETSAVHHLSLEAVDILGLSRLSVETPVEINVVIPPPDLPSIIRTNAPALAGLAVILLAGIALFIFVSQGRIQPGVTNIFQSFSTKWVQFTKSRTLIKKILPGKNNDPEESPDLTKNSYRLIAINDVSQQLFPEPVRVDEHEIKIGSSLPVKGIQVKHPSVIKEHAMINCLSDKKFQITDLGSTAGTWINYQQIKSGKPQFLKDGDIIHIGEAIFRFQVMIRMETPLVTEEKRT
jgi:hypothetical protein